MAIINVGSRNPTKIRAVETSFIASGLFSDLEVRSVDVDIEEFGHPKTIEETIRGAKERARAAFSGCVYGVGIESGLLQAAGTKTGYLETTVCAIYDGNHFAVGLGPSFEWPPQVLKAILDGRDGSQAFKEAGLTSSEKIGKDQGAISVLTKGGTNRTEQNKIAVDMAVAQLLNSEIYEVTND